MSSNSVLVSGQLIAAGFGALNFVIMLAVRRLAQKPSVMLALVSALQFWAYLALAELIVYLALQTADPVKRIMLPILGVCVGGLVIRRIYVWAYHHIRDGMRN